MPRLSVLSSIVGHGVMTGYPNLPESICYIHSAHEPEAAVVLALEPRSKSARARKWYANHNSFMAGSF